MTDKIKIGVAETSNPVSARGLVYLAGAISGRTYQEARYGWRRRFAELLAPGIEPLSPLRDSDDIVGNKNDVLKKWSNRPPGIFCDAGITRNSMIDVKRCDVMVAYLYAPTEGISQGTDIEFGWASAFGKPIVSIMDAGWDSGEYFMLRQLADYRVDSVERGARIVNRILTPGV